MSGTVSLFPLRDEATAEDFLRHVANTSPDVAIVIAMTDGHMQYGAIDKSGASIPLRETLGYMEIAKWNMLTDASE